MIIFIMSFHFGTVYIIVCPDLLIFILRLLEMCKRKAPPNPQKSAGRAPVALTNHVSAFSSGLLAEVYM